MQAVRAMVVNLIIFNLTDPIDLEGYDDLAEVA